MSGNAAKADRIKVCNLGRIKLDARKESTQKHLRNIAFKLAHTLADKACVIIFEDLTYPGWSSAASRQVQCAQPPSSRRRVACAPP